MHGLSALSRCCCLPIGGQPGSLCNLQEFGMTIGDFRSSGFGCLSRIKRNETAGETMTYEYLQVMRRRSGQLYLQVLSMAAMTTTLGFDFF